MTPWTDRQLTWSHRNELMASETVNMKWLEKYMIILDIKYDIKYIQILDISWILLIVEIHDLISLASGS